MWGSRGRGAALRRAVAPGVVVPGVVLAAVLAGCGGHPSGTAPAPVATTGAHDLPTPTETDGNGPMVPALPSLSAPVKPTRPASPTPGPAQKTVAGRLFGADLSWPQCPKGMGIPEKRTEGRPMPTAAARFVVIGLTNGPSFVANPCLADQLAWATRRHLLVAAYSVVSYPDDRTVAQLRDRGPFDGDTRLGGLRNVGYQAALFNVATMRGVGLTTPVVWIDVEPVTHFDWSNDLVANAAVVQGVARGYRDAGYGIGFYSIPSLWTRVVGTLRLGGPEWRPAGERGLAEAINRCGDDWSFQGGPGVLGQWVEDGRDRNVTCPGAIDDPRQWFHQS